MAAGMLPALRTREIRRRRLRNEPLVRRLCSTLQVRHTERQSESLPYRLLLRYNLGCSDVPCAGGSHYTRGSRSWESPHIWKVRNTANRLPSKCNEKEKGVCSGESRTLRAQLTGHVRTASTTTADNEIVCIYLLVYIAVILVMKLCSVWRVEKTQRS
jgi:hypothetical protein